MKELMRNQAKPVRVLGALSLGPTPCHKHAAIVVLQPATRLRRQVKEPIFLVWSIFPKRLLRLNNLRDIFCRCRCIPKWFASQRSQMMFRATHLKGLNIYYTQ